MTSWISNDMRRKVTLSSKGKCYMCGKRAAKATIDKRGLPALYDENGHRFQIDHKVLESEGGKTELDNLGMACAKCNLEKKKKPGIRKEVEKFVKMINQRAKR